MKQCKCGKLLNIFLIHGGVKWNAALQKYVPDLQVEYNRCECGEKNKKEDLSFEHLKYIINFYNEEVKKRNVPKEIKRCW